MAFRRRADELQPLHLAEAIRRVVEQSVLVGRDGGEPDAAESDENLAVDLEGAAAQAWDEDDRWLRGTAWSLLRVRSKTIAGGTSEVQRNILGERILGLPKEAEVDRDVPWSKVLRS